MNSFMNSIDGDQYEMPEGNCFLAQPYTSEDFKRGKIEKIYMRECPEKQVCNINPGLFVWLQTDLQLRNLTANERRMTNYSQFFNRVRNASCVAIADLWGANKNAGQKCLDPSVCVSRQCDGDTKTCDGKKVGENCANHAECDSDLACRMSSVFPYQTSC